MQTQRILSTISARDIQRGYKKVFEKVKKTNRPVIVMANNKPQAAIISLEMLGAYNTYLKDKELFAIIDQVRLQNSAKDPEEVEADIAATVEAVRQKIYEETFGGS